MMKNPPHPTEMLQDTLLDDYGLTLQESAKMLGLPFARFANLFAKKAKITPNLAYRLGLAGISNARFWLALQANYDLAEFIQNKSKEPKVDVAKFAQIREQIKKQNQKEKKKLDEIAKERAMRKNESVFAEMPPRVRNIRKTSHSAAPARV